jgi:hypothetical protein
MTRNEILRKMTITNIAYNTRHSIFKFLTIFSLFFMCNSPLFAMLTATAERTEIYENETLELTIRYGGQAQMNEPDFGSLKTDFEIISTNRQQQYTWSNGQAESYTDWNLTLLPLATGKLVVPSLNYAGHVSNAIEIQVRKASALSNQKPAAQAIFSETTIDKTTSYVQEQLLLTQRLYTSVSLTDYSLTPLVVEDAVIEQVAENQFQKRIDGRDYLVIELRYAIFPQASGMMSIPSQRFGAFEVPTRRQFGLFNRRGSQVIRVTEEKMIKILNRPTQVPSFQWLPSSKVELTEIWNGDLGELRVGEPITRTITMTAEGQTGAQINPLELPSSSDFKLYPDQAQIETRKTNNGALGVRIESMALVPKREGQITLPSIDVNWWNTLTKQIETTSVESRTLNVQSSADLANMSNTPLQQDKTIILSPTEDVNDISWDSRTFQLLTLSLSANVLLICGLIALLLWRTKNGSFEATLPSIPAHSKRANMKQLVDAIQKQMQANDLLDARANLLKWGQLVLQNSSSVTLQDLASKLNDPVLSQGFSRLDQHLYHAESTEMSDQNLIIERLKMHSNEATYADPKKQLGLKPLYPQDTSR